MININFKKIKIKSVLVRSKQDLHDITAITVTINPFSHCKKHLTVIPSSLFLKNVGAVLKSYWAKGLTRFRHIMASSYSSVPTCRKRYVGSSRDGTLGGVTYELQYRSKVMQDWALVPTKTPNKILTGLSPGHVYFFRVRAANSEGWGDFSSDTEFKMPTHSEREKEGAPAEEESDSTA